MTNLPSEVSSFIGREAALTELPSVLTSARFLTLVGPAGVGKTRLGLRLALRVTDRFRDGVWYVDLASVLDPAMLPHVVARVLQVREEPGQPIIELLVRRLREPRLLLVLDTCEHQLEGCTQLALTLLGACPHLHVLAISRDPLETDGDTLWRVPPMSLPAATAAQRTEVASSEAVQLFVARAQEHNARFSITTRNSLEIGTICRQLDGLPLALELVAARIGSAGPDAAAEPLRQSLVGSLGGDHTGRDREQIVSATLAWSHRQLTNAERVLFRRLAVFAGSWDLVAVQNVCVDERLSPEEVPAALYRLIAGSLVMVTTEVRFQLLAAVQGYALEQLDAAGERDMFLRRQLTYMVELAERAAPEAMSAEHATLLERELDNLRAALFWALSNDEAELALRLATAACSLWYFRGYYAEGCAWLKHGLALATDGDGVVRARAMAWLGQLLQFRGEYESAEYWLTLGWQKHEVLADSLGSALALAMLGQLLLMRGDLLRARVECAEAAARLAARHPTISVASRLQLAVIAIELGDFERADREIDECEILAVGPHSPFAAWILFLKGRLAEARGEVTDAYAQLSEALRLGRQMSERTAIVTSLVELGHVQLEQGWSEDARASFVEAIELGHESGERIQLARALEGLAGSWAVEQPAIAIQLAAAAGKLRSAMGSTAWPTDQLRIAAWLPAIRHSLKPAQYRSIWHEGQALSVDEAVRLARSLTSESSARPEAKHLTRREEEVIALLAQALTTAQIATRLGITQATARTHIEHVLAKLGLHTRAQVVVWVAQHAARTPR